MIVSPVESLGGEALFRYRVAMAPPAVNAALIAAAAHQQAETAKLITDPLRKAGATGPRSAIELDLSAKGASKLLDGLVKRGHVRAAGGGRYWLDEAAIAKSKAAGNRAALIILAFTISLAASLWAIALSLN
jgi:hypothetical protein